jgi:plasmid stabilization system protein ParE
VTYALSAEAERELAEAFAHYLENASAKVAERFLNEFVRAAGLVDANPGLGTPSINGRLIFPIRRFPYSLIYRPSDEGVRIGAVAHQRRRPRYWRARD